MEIRVTSNGRIVIPALVRHRLGITRGTRIQVEVDELSRQVVLTPITREYVHSLRGKYKGKGLLKTLMAEKEQARASR